MSKPRKNFLDVNGISIGLFKSGEHSNFTIIRFPCHTHIHTLMSEAAMQGPTTYQEQFVVQYLAQGYFEMQPGEIRISNK